MPDVPTVADLAAVLDAALGAERYARDGDPAGVWIDAQRPVRRLGLRVEAGRAPYPWADSLDALLLHRPFGLWPARLPAGLGVLAYHGALDDAVWTGPHLPRALHLVPDSEPLLRDGAPIGTVGTLPEPLAWPDLLDRLAAETGAPDEAHAPAAGEEVQRVAVVGAMTEPLVEAARQRGADVYVTGQVRRPARAAVERTGTGVVAVGQAASERWGLRWLAGLLRERWPGLDVVDLDAP